MAWNHTGRNNSPKNGMTILWAIQQEFYNKRDILINRLILFNWCLSSAKYAFSDFK